MERSQLAAFFIEFFAFVLRIVPIPNLSKPETGADSLALPYPCFLLRQEPTLRERQQSRGEKLFQMMLR